MRFYNLILMAVIVVLAGCSRHPREISITNRSSTTISNLCVKGTLFSLPLPVGPLASGASLHFEIPKQSEQQAWLTFEADGKKYDSKGKEMFEFNQTHLVSVWVDVDFTVQSSRAIKKE
jgi:hypothetical protein